jgi:cytochrome c553
MNRKSSPVVRSMLVAMMALVTAAGAAGAATTQVIKVDPAKGATLYADGDAARGLPSCVSCHGAAGNSTIVANPKLAGQPDSYLYKQLVDFTKPERAHPIMTTYAKMLTDEEKKNISAYLAAQPQKPGAAKNRDSIDLGKKIYRGGLADKRVPACASCHGPAGAGNPAKYPRIGGQHQDYTIAQLGAFKGHGRKNSVEMTTIAQRMSDDEIKAVADYVAGLK